MPFVIVGALLVAMKLADISPVNAWAWGWVAAPLGVALLWWWYADASGLNKRREMSRLEERKAERRRGAPTADRHRRGQARGQACEGARLGARQPLRQ